MRHILVNTAVTAVRCIDVQIDITRAQRAVADEGAADRIQLAHDRDALGLNRPGPALSQNNLFR